MRSRNPDDQVSATRSKPSIVIFGAGNIGRSFIAPVFVDGGYEVVFIDIAPGILRALARRTEYEVVYKADSGDRSRLVGPVRGIAAADPEAVSRELNSADFCVTCVGSDGLPVVLRSISAAIRDRRRPFDIVLAENLTGAADFARRVMTDAGIPAGALGERIGLVESSIGKMVPSMPADIASKDPLLCWAEPFNTLIVDADGFTGAVPKAPDLAAVSPIAPWVGRKLHIHNFAHASAAYLGFRSLPDLRFIWEVLDNPGLATAIETVMRIAGKSLRMEYPDVFTAEDIENHIADLISRFRNRALGDTVYRVGRDLRRKLHRRDRIIGTLDLIRKHGLDIEAPLDVFRAALSFAALKPDGAPDQADAEVRREAADPAGFLKSIVQVDERVEPELYRILWECLKSLS